MTDPSFIKKERLEEFKQLSDGEDDFLIELLDKFIPNTKELLDTSQKAIQESDLEKIKFNMHTLKGASLNIGLTRMSEFVLELYNKQTYTDLEKFAKDLKTLQSLLDEVISYRKSLT